MNDKIHLIERNGLKLIYFIDSNRIVKPINSKVFDTISKTNKEDFIRTNEDSKIIKEFESIIKLEDNNISFRTYDYFKLDRTNSSKITLMLTQDCNLACKYCYGGDSGKYNSSGEIMSKEIAFRAIDYLFKKSPNENFYYITFFGGEPLLNFTVLRQTVEYCEELFGKYEKKVGYAVTTNATLLKDEYIDFLKEKEFGITISMDGTKEIHDKYRVFPNQKGSYDIIVKNIEKLVKKNIRFTIRATLAAEFFDKYDEVYSHLISLGANSVFISRVSVYSNINNNKLSYIERDSDNNDLSTSFNKKTINSDKLNSIKKEIEIEKIISSIRYASRKRIFCGFMKGCIAVSCNGDFYPCQRYVGLDGFEFGNLNNGIDKKRMQNILDELDKNTRKCEKCFARNICQRNCIRDISVEGGTFYSFSDEFCEQTRTDIENSIIKYYNYLLSLKNKTDKH